MEKGLGQPLIPVDNVSDSKRVPRYPNLQDEERKEDSERKNDMEPEKTEKNVRDYLGVLTLLALGATGVLGAYMYHSKAYWVQVPFYGTIVGAFGGAIWEIFGNLNGRWADTVGSWRSANVGIVAGSILYLFIRLGYGTLANWPLILLVSTIGSLLFSNSFLQQQTNRSTIILITLFISCIVMGAHPGTESLVPKADSYYMSGFAAFLLAAFFALGIPDPRRPKIDPNLQTPPQSVPNFPLFHFVNAVGSALSVYALRNVNAPGTESFTSYDVLALFLGIILGSALNFIQNPLAVSEFLNILSGFVWNFILRILLKQKPWEPVQLLTFKPQERIITKPYSENHPHTSPFSCPSAVTIPLDQQRNFAFIKFLFSIVDNLDIILPRARMVPLKDKIRLKSNQLSQYYWNSVLIQGVVPIQTTPKLARKYFEEGQFLQYIVLFSHATNMIRKTAGKEQEYGTHVLDFEYLSKYQTKEDYLPYGGKCFFKLKEGTKKEIKRAQSPKPRATSPSIQTSSSQFQDPQDHKDVKVQSPKPKSPGNQTASNQFPESQGNKDAKENKYKDQDEDARLDVVGVMGPESDEFVNCNPDDWKFRQIEQIIVASAFFEVVVGKHLLGIHVMMNTVPIALHNAFDVKEDKKEESKLEIVVKNNDSTPQKSGYHPFRVALNLHFFNHIFVNELTTAHLLAENSVFPQIFATTHSGLCEYLNDGYRSFEYAKDAKIEERVAVMNNTFPKTSQLAVEQELMKIFRDYGTDVVEVLYKSDSEVAEDKQIQNLKDEMNKLVYLGLPHRFDFKTKKGLALFFAESVHVVTVSHEIYGTKSTFLGLDPSIMSGQVPRDYSPDAVDVYNSVAWVGLATAQAKFANLQQDFKYLLKAIDSETTRKELEEVYDNFQIALEDYQAKNKYDYAHLRVLPIHLETGAGY